MSTDQWDIVTGVGRTALAVAAGRAAETARPDALMSDPYASRLVAAAQPGGPFTALGKNGGQEPEDELWAATSEYVGLRSRVFDDYFASASAEGLTQVVILAAGLDTRPYRLGWPSGTVCYELDQPAVLEFKTGVLDAEGAEPGCDHRPVPVDLRDDWGAALRAAGHDAASPTAWLAEGLLPYLPPEAEARLLQEMSRLSAPGSRFAVERIDDIARLVDDPVLQEGSDDLGIDVKSLFPEGEREPVENQLVKFGWELENRTVPEAAAALGRPMTRMKALTEHVTHTFGRLPA